MENKKELKNKSVMGETMKLKEKILGYFRTYWKKNVFGKSVSVLVAACFVLNIVNLPAFAASSDDDLLNKRVATEKDKTGVYNAEENTYVKPAEAVKEVAMGTISEDGGVFKQNGKFVGTVVEGEVYVSHGNAGLRKNEGYTNLLEDKVAKYAKEAGLIVSDGEGGNIQMAVDGDTYNRMVKEISKGSKISEETVIAVLNKMETEQEAEGLSVLESAIHYVKKGASAAGEGLKSAGEAAANFIGKVFNSKEEQEKYDDVVNTLVDQTGMTKENVETALSNLDEEQLDNAVGVLSDFFAQGGSIVNCATDALATVLDMTNKGVLAFQALLADISAGLFSKESIQDGQLMTSMSAMNTVLQSYGKDSAGYGMSLDAFMEGLGDGESGILWVDGDHFVTVTKDGENFSVTDPNRNEGKAETYSADEFKKLMSGEEATTADGKKTEGYQLERDADGNVLVKTLTDSQGVAEAAGEEGVLTEEEMSQITGAKYVTQTATRTRMETRTGTRTEDRTGTRTETGYKSVKNDDGTYSSEAYTYTVEYTYQVEVEYTYEVEVQYEVEETVWVDDPEDKETEEQKQAIIELERQKEEARKAAQEAQEQAERERAEAEAARRNLEAEQAAREAAEKKEIETKNTQEATAEGIAASKAVEENIAAMEESLPQKEEQAAASEKAAEEKITAAEAVYDQVVESVKESVNRNAGKEGQVTAEGQAAIDMAQKDRDAIRDPEVKEITITKVLSVTDSEGQTIEGAADAFNAAIQAGIGTLNGSFAQAFNNLVMGAAIAIAEGALEVGGGVKDFVMGMFSSGEKPGVYIDEAKGRVVEFGANGITGEIKLGEDTDYDELRKMTDANGYQGALNFAKQSGALESETKYDDNGKEIYTAENIGYKNGTMALQYDFKQDYSNETTITGVKAGESKVVVEEYNGADRDYSLSRSMTYSVDDDKTTQDLGGGSTLTSRKEGEEYTTASGVKFTAAIGELERVTEFSNKDIDGTTYRVANTVEFSGGKPSAFEEAVMTGDGIAVTRYDLSDAVSKTKLEQAKGSGSGGSKDPTLVDEYANILSLTSKLKLKGNNSSDLYSGYSKVSNDYIDMKKITTSSYNTAQPNTVNKNMTGSNGESISVSAQISNPTDWRTNPGVIENDVRNSVTITTKLDGGGYKVETLTNVTIDQNLGYDGANANTQWATYDSGGNITGGGADIKQGSTMPVSPGTSDTITFDKDVKFEYTMKNGKTVMIGDYTAEDMKISGVYTNYSGNEKIGTGRVEGTYEIDKNGVATITGKVTIDADSAFRVGKGSSSQQDGDESTEQSKTKPDASDTNAKVVEDANGYNISEGTISLRGGALVVMGNGATFSTGSNLEGIGRVSEGNLRVGVDNDGNYTFVAAEGTCKVDRRDGSINTSTRYDTEGVVRIYRENTETGATLLEEYKNYDEKTGNTSPILDANGKQSSRTTLTAAKTGDTGLGYYVDSLGGNKSVVLVIGADGTTNLNSGASIFKEMAENEAGEKMGILYSGNADGSATMKYQFNGESETYDLYTEDNQAFYGIDKNDNVMELLREGTSFTSKDVTSEFEKKIEEGITTYTRNNDDGTTRSQTILVQIEGGLIVNTVLKEINTPESGWQSVDSVMNLPGMTADDKLVNIETANGKNILYALTKDGWKTGDSMRVGEYEVSKTENDGWTARNIYGKDNAIYNLTDINGAVSFEITKLREEGKDVWHEVDKTLTAPDGSGQLVSARILDEKGNYKYDAYFTLGADGSWVTSDKELQIGNYTAKKDSGGQWTLGNDNVIYNINVADNKFDLGLSKINHEGRWLGVNDIIGVPDGSGSIVNAGNNMYFTLDENGNWVTGDTMKVGNYNARKGQDGSLLVYDADTEYKVSLADKQLQMEMSQIYDRQSNQWNKVNCTTAAPDGSGIVISAQIKDSDGNYIYDAYYTLDANNKWISSENLEVGNYTLSKENGKWLFSDDNTKFLLTTVVDKDGNKTFNTSFDSFRLNTNDTWYTGHEIQQLPGGGTLILGRIDDDLTDRHYSFYCTTDANGNIVQIADGMQIGEFTIGKDDAGWYMSNAGGSSILNTNGMNGELSGIFRLGHSVQTDDFGSVISGEFSIKTAQDQNIQYTNPNGSISNIILNSGAEIIMQGDGMFIMDGIATIPNDGTKITIPAGSKGASGGGATPDGTGTNAYIQGLSDGSFNVSNGTLRISNGDFVVEGLGAIAKKGSTFNLGGTTITAQGNLTYKANGWYGSYSSSSFYSSVYKYRSQTAKNLGVDISQVSCSATNSFYGYINNYGSAMNNKIANAGMNISVKAGDTVQGAKVESLTSGSYLHYNLKSGSVSVKGGTNASITFARDFSNYNYYVAGSGYQKVGMVRSTFKDGNTVDVSMGTMLGNWMGSNNVGYVSMSTNSYENGLTVAGYTTVAQNANMHNPYSTGGYIGFKYDETTGKAVTADNMYISSYGETLFKDADGNDVKSATIMAGSTIRDIGPNGEITFDSANIKVYNYESSCAMSGTPAEQSDEPSENIITDPSVNAYFDGTADLKIRTNSDGSVYYDDDNQYYVDVKGTGIFYGCTIGDDGVISGMSAETVAFSANSTLQTGSSLEVLVDGKIQKGEVLGGAIVNDRYTGWTTAYQDATGAWIAGYDENGKTGQFQWNTDLSGYFIDSYYAGFEYKDSVNFTGIKVEGAILSGTSLVEGYLNTNNKISLPIVAKDQATIMTADGSTEVSAGTILNVSTAHANGTKVFHTTYGGNVNGGESQAVFKLTEGLSYDGYDSEKGIAKTYSATDIGTEISVLAAIGPNVEIKSIYPGSHTSLNSAGGISATEGLDVSFGVKIDENGHAWLSNNDSFEILFDNGAGAGEQSYTVDKGSIVQVGAFDTDKGKAMAISLVDATIRMTNVNYGPMGENDGGGDSNNTGNGSKGVEKGEGTGVYYVDADNNMIASGIINNASTATLASDLSRNNVQSNFYATDAATASFFNKAFAENAEGLYRDGKIDLTFSYKDVITEETEANGLVLNNVTMEYGFSFDEETGVLGSSQILASAGANALVGTVAENGERQLLDNSTISGMVGSQVDAAAVNQAYAMQEYTKNVHTEAENVFGSANVKRDGNNITVNGQTYDITDVEQMESLSTLIFKEKAQNLGEEAADLLGANAVKVSGYTIEMNGQVYDVRSAEDIEVFNKNLGLYREAYAEQVADVITDIYGDEAKVTGTSVTINGKTYDMTKTEDIQSLQTVANTKNIANQVEGVFGSGNVKVDGVYVVVDGTKYNTTSEAEMAKLNSALNQQNAYNILSKDLKPGQSIAYDGDGKMMIVNDSDLLNYAGEGLFNLAGNDQQITVNGVTKFIDEGNIKTVNIDNGTITVTSDDRVFFNAFGSVNVTEYTIGGDGGVTKVDMNAEKALWFINWGTSTEVTQFGSMDMENGVKTSYDNSNASFWEWGDSKCGNLLDYANGTLEGSFTLNKDTTLSGGTYEITSSLNNQFNLDAGTYYGSGIRMGSGDSALVVSTVRDANVSPEGVPSFNNGKVVASSVSQVSGIVRGEDLMNLDKSKDGVPFDVNSFTTTNQVVYDNFGFIKTIENYSGESYIDSTNTIQAANLSGTVNNLQLGTITDSSYNSKLSSYNQARLDDLSDIGYGKCVALADSGIEGTYNGQDLNDFYIFTDNKWYGHKTTTIINPKTEDKFSATAGPLKTPIIREGGEKGTVTDALTIKESNGTVTISVSEQTVKSWYYDDYGDKEYSYNNINPVQEITVSYGKDGTTTMASSSVVKDENGALTNMVNQKTVTTSLLGEQAIKDITANYNPGGGYDKKLFIEPQNLMDMSGYSVKLNSAGEASEFTVISGSMTDIKWNNNQMVQRNMVDYMETLYMPKSGSIDGPALEGGLSIPGVANASDWAKQSTTVQNGMVYTVHSDKDLKYIPAEYKASIDMEDIIDPETGRTTGQKLSSKVESVTINDGVTKDVYKPTLNAAGEYEDVLSSREVITSVEQAGKTMYSTDGINYVELNNVKDGSNVLASQSSKKVTMSTVVETLLENGKPVVDKATGQEITVTTTIDSPYTETTTNYYGAADRTVTVNGQPVKIPAITSETVTSGVNQTTTRSDAPGVEMKLTDYNRTVVNYADGTSKTDITAASEQIYDKNSGTVSTEFNINETVLTDLNNNSYTNRNAERAEIRDAKTNDLVQTAHDIFTYTSLEDGIKTVEREIGTTKAFETYVEDGVEKTLMTVSSNSSSKDVYKDGHLTSSESDTGDFMVITDASMEYDANGLAIGAKATDASRVIRNGREVNEETYIYEDENGNPTAQAASVKYERTSYDYTDMSVTINEGTKTNKYENADSTGELVETTDRYHSDTYGLNSDRSISDNLRRTEEGYTREYDIKTTTYSDGSTSRTSKSDSYSQSSDFVNDKHTVTANTNVNTSILKDKDGNIVDKTVTGDLRTWMFDSKESLNAVDLDSVISAGGYTGTSGELDPKHSYSYTNDKYTYDHFGRETGYDFTRTYTNGEVIGGRNTTAYMEEVGDLVYSEALGIMVPSVTTYSSSASVAEDGRELDSSGGYYGNSGIGNTSTYKSMESTDFKQVNLSNIAAEVFGDAMLRKGFAGITTAERNENIKVAVAAVVAVATVAFVVCTGGLGIAAVPGLLAGTTTTAALVGAATATAWSTIGLVASALVTSYLVTSSVVNAVDSFQQEGFFSANAWLNLGAAALAFMFPVKIGPGAGYAKAALEGTAKTFQAGQAIGQAAALKDAAIRTAAKAAAREATREALKQGAKEATQHTMKSALSFMATNPWGTRLALAGITTGVDVLFKDQENAVLDLFRSMSLAQFVGLGGNISKDSWLNNDFLGIDGLKWGSMMPILGYIALPSLVNGISGAVSRGAFRPENIKMNMQAAGDAVKNGFLEARQKIGNLIGYTEKSMRAAGAGGFALETAFTAWGGITSHMYSMAQLQVFMGGVGKIYNMTDSFGMKDSYFRDLTDFVLSEMGQGEGLINLNLGSSLFFGVVMYGGMPIAQGLFKGGQTLFAGAPTVTATTAAAAANAATQGSGNMFDKLLDRAANSKAGQIANRYVGGLIEEGLSENIVQALITPYVGADAAEFLSEFLSPDGASATSMTEFASTIARSNYTSLEGAQYAATNINQFLANNGYSNLQVSARANDSGSYDIRISNASSNGQYTDYSFSSRNDMQQFMLSVASVASQKSGLGDSGNANLGAFNTSLNNTRAAISANNGFATSELGFRNQLANEDVMPVITQMAGFVANYSDASGNFDMNRFINDNGYNAITSQQGASSALNNLMQMMQMNTVNGTGMQFNVAEAVTRMDFQGTVANAQVLANLATLSVLATENGDANLVDAINNKMGDIYSNMTGGTLNYNFNGSDAVIDVLTALDNAGLSDAVIIDGGNLSTNDLNTLRSLVAQAEMAEAEGDWQAYNQIQSDMNSLTANGVNLNVQININALGTPGFLHQSADIAYQDGDVQASNQIASQQGEAVANANNILQAMSVLNSQSGMDVQNIDIMINELAKNSEISARTLSDLSNPLGLSSMNINHLRQIDSILHSQEAGTMSSEAQALAQAVRQQLQTKLADSINNEANDLAKMSENESRIIESFGSRDAYNARAKYVEGLQQIINTEGADLYSLMQDAVFNGKANSVSTLINDYKNSLKNSVNASINSQRGNYTSSAIRQARSNANSAISNMSAFETIGMSDMSNLMDIAALTGKPLSKIVNVGNVETFTKNGNEINMLFKNGQSLSVSLNDLHDLGLISAIEVQTTTVDSAEVDTTTNAASKVDANTAADSAHTRQTLSLNVEFNGQTVEISGITLSEQDIQQISDNKGLSEMLIEAGRQDIIDYFKSGSTLSTEQGRQLAESTANDRFEQLKKGALDGYSIRDFLYKFSTVANTQASDPILTEARGVINLAGVNINGGTELVRMNAEELVVFANTIAATLGVDVNNLSASDIRTLLNDYQGAVEKISNAKGRAETQSVTESINKNNPNLQKIMEGSGYNTYDSIIPKISALMDIVSDNGGNTWSEINSQYETAKTQVDTFISNNRNSDGSLSKGALDKFKAEVLDTMDAAPAAVTLRYFVQDLIKQAKLFDGKGEYTYRASQAEMVSSFLRGENIALGMGGGKTISFAVSAVINRILMGQDANIEILVGNDDPSNFVGDVTYKDGGVDKGKERALFEFVGMKLANLADYKPEGGSSNVAGIEQIYYDADTVVIATPTNKAHMLNEAISSGREGLRLSNALNSVNMVFADEVHLWALTTTAAVIGGNNNPPKDAAVEDLLKVAGTINAASIAEQLKAKEAESGWTISTDMTINGTQQTVEIQHFNEFSQAEAAMMQANRDGTRLIAVIGSTSASRNIKMSDSMVADFKGSAIDSGMLDSVLRGMFAKTEMGGMAISTIDGKVKPFGAGIQENMVIGDINYQMGFALKYALNNGTSDNSGLKQFIQSATQTSDTSMQTSLAALYGRSHATIVGGSGTVSGLEQLIIGRSGAGVINNITGETVNINDFAVEQGKSTEGVVEGVLDSVLAKDADLNNALFLAKSAANIAAITDQVRTMAQEAKAQGFEIYVFAGQDQGIMNADGSITPMSSAELSKIAKAHSSKRIIISNEFGETGIDYQGRFELALWDADLMNNADLAQAIKRVGRPGSKGLTDGTGRWRENRTIVYNSNAYASRIQEFASNQQLVNMAKQLWKGEMAKDVNGNGYLANEQALKILDKIDLNAARDGKFNLDQSGITNAEMVEFISNIQTLYSVDGSVRFALNDAMRDKMLLSVLRDLEQRTTGTDRLLVSQALNEALAKGEQSSDFSYSQAQSANTQNGAEVIADSFERISQEAVNRLSRLNLSDAAANAVISNQLDQIKMAANFTEMGAIKTQGLSDTIDLLEFMQVIQSFEEYILPMRSQSAAQTQNITVSEAANNLSAFETDIANDYKAALGSDASLYTVNENEETVLSEKGKIYLDLAQNNLNNNSVSQRIVQLLLAALLGGGIPPEEKAAYTAAASAEDLSRLAGELSNHGITDIGKVNSLIDTVSAMGSVKALEKIDTAAQLKTILNAKHPMQVAESLSKMGYSLPSAQAVAIARLSEADDMKAMTEQYDKLVEKFYDATGYKVKPADRVAMLHEEFGEKLGAAGQVANFVGGTLKYLAMLPIIRVMNNVFGVDAKAAGYDLGQSLRQSGAIAVARALFPNTAQEKAQEKAKKAKADSKAKARGEKVEPAELGMVDNLLLGAVGAIEGLRDFINDKSFQRAAKAMDSFVNPDLSEKTTEEIEEALNLTNLRTDSTKEAVGLYEWARDNEKLSAAMKEASGKLNISDIDSFLGLKSLKALSEDGKVDLSTISAENIVDIVKGKKSLMEVVNAKFSELYDKETDKGTEGLKTEEEKASKKSSNKRSMTMPTVAELAKESGVDLDTAVGFVLPAYDPQEVISKYDELNGINAQYAQDVSLSQLASDKSANEIADIMKQREEDQKRKIDDLMKQMGLDKQAEEGSAAASAPASQAQTVSDTPSTQGEQAPIITTGQQQIPGGVAIQTPLANLEYDTEEIKPAIQPEASAQQATPVNVGAQAEAAKQYQALANEVSKILGVPGAGEELLNVIVNGYSKADDMEKGLMVSLLRFADLDAMKKYIEVKDGMSANEIMAQTYDKFGMALKAYKDKDLTDEEFKEETETIRAVMEIIVASLGDKGVADIVNKKGSINENDIYALQAKVDRGMQVNKYVVAEEMVRNIKVGTNSISIGKLEISIKELKQAIERKEPKSNMLLNKNRKEILDLLAGGGSRGQEAFMTPMSIKKARAISAAA